MDKRLRMGEGSASGVPWGDGLGQGDLGRLGGKISNGISRLFRHETPLHCAHVTPETRRDVVGLGDPVERFLARTSRGNRWWVSRELQIQRLRGWEHLSVMTFGRIASGVPCYCE
jgi:hypothetical protein